MLQKISIIWPLKSKRGLLKSATKVGFILIHPTFFTIHFKILKIKCHEKIKYLSCFAETKYSTILS